jgi:hypothetical protein
VVDNAGHDGRTRNARDARIERGLQ